MAKKMANKEQVFTYNKKGDLLIGSVSQEERELRESMSSINAKIEDYCPVCNHCLFLSFEHTSRIAIMNNVGDDVVGWICPECYSQFDMEDNPEILLSKSNIQGES